MASTSALVLPPAKHLVTFIGASTTNKAVDRMSCLGIVPDAPSRRRLRESILNPCIRSSDQHCQQDE